MSSVSKEQPVALENLDAHLKALVKTRMREFVHLSPLFLDVPAAIDLNSYMKFESLRKRLPHRESPLDCPHSYNSFKARRRARAVRVEF